MITAVAVVLLMAVVAYAVFGGADFGAGFWDLTAGGPERGARPRGHRTLDRTRVEANHVWLIFIFVILWTSFSRGIRLDHADPVRSADESLPWASSCAE